ncbi:MAG: hypothetical protein ACLFTJ_06495 [Halothece sp.]
MSRDSDNKFSEDFEELFSSLMKSLPTESEDSNLAELKAKQAKEKRLLRLVVQFIQKTGECNYPPLVDRLRDWFEVENSSAGLLTQHQIQDLEQRLDYAITTIEAAIQLINVSLQELKNCLKHPESVSSREQGISEQFQDSLHNINYQVADIIEQAKKYLCSEMNSKENTQSNQEEKESIHDLRYFCAYLNEYLQVEKIKQDYSLTRQEPPYLQRIDDYQNSLLTEAEALKESIKSELEERRTGGNFASKESVDSQSEDE